MLHESFWVVVGTAAPVIALAAIVAFTDIARGADELDSKYPNLDPETISQVLKITISGYVLVFVDVVLQAVTLLLTLLSLAARRDQVPLIVPEIMASLGIVLLLVSGVLTAVLRFTEPESGPPGDKAQGSPS